MNHLRWHLRNRMTQIGSEGCIGLGLLILSLMAYAFVLLPSASRLQQLHRELTKHQTAAPSVTTRQPPSEEEQLTAYYHYFPAQRSTPDWLEKIFKAAHNQHLQLIEGKYSEKRERAGSLMRYEINLPVTGSYHQLHLFLAHVLKEIPVAALEGVSFERRKIGSPLVNAKIKLVLYLGRPT